MQRVNHAHVVMVRLPASDRKYDRHTTRVRHCKTSANTSDQYNSLIWAILQSIFKSFKVKVSKNGKKASRSSFQSADFPRVDESLILMTAQRRGKVVT